MGVRQTPERVVRAAIEEDVQVIGLSILSGAHLHLTGRVTSLLKEQNADEIMVLVGGVIPEEDKPKLKEMGVAEVFTSGTSINDAVQVIRQRFAEA